MIHSSHLYAGDSVKKITRNYTYIPTLMAPLFTSQDTESTKMSIWRKRKTKWCNSKVEHDSATKQKENSVTDSSKDGPRDGTVRHVREERTAQGIIGTSAP